MRAAFGRSMLKVGNPTQFIQFWLQIFRVINIRLNLLPDIRDIPYKTVIVHWRSFLALSAFPELSAPIIL